MSVLKSLTATRCTASKCSGPFVPESVLRFLLQSTRFLDPCGRLCSPFAGASKLLIRTPPLPRRLPQVLRQVSQLEPEGLAGEKLHALIDELQRGFADIHGQLERRHFRPSRSADPEAVG